MEIRISDSVKDKLNTMHDLMGAVINELKPDFGSDHSATYPSKEEEFRFYLCLVSMTDCITGVKKLRHAATMTDDEVREMCAEAGVTVSTAINNIKHNMVGELLSDMLGQIFAPPQH